MDEKEKIYYNLLKRINFFSEMTNSELRDVATTTKHFRKFNGGEYIIMEGGEDRSLYIILRGKAVITKRNKPKIYLAVLDEGSPFGEMSLISKRQRITDVKAYQGEILVLEIGENFLKGTNPDIPAKVKDKVIEILVERLDEMNNKLLKLEASIK